MALFVSVIIARQTFSGENGSIPESTKARQSASAGMPPDPSNLPVGSPPSGPPADSQQQIASSPSSSYIPSPVAAQQIESFKNGSGILLNVHITHHGGTTMCRELGQTLKHPPFACMGFRKTDNIPNRTLFPNKHPWSHDKTASNIDFIRQSFDLQFVSWEDSKPPPRSSVSA